MAAIYRYIYNEEELYNPNPTGQTRRGEKSGEKWTEDGDCSTTHTFPIYAYRPLDPTDESNLECENGTTYVMGEAVVSNDGGTTWTPVAGEDTVRLGVYETNSDLCRTMWKWVVVSGEYECVGEDKYIKLRKYESEDRGTTWTATDEYTRGGVAEYSSTDCGWTTEWISGEDLTFWRFDDASTPATTCVGTTKMYDESEYTFQPSTQTISGISIKVPDITDTGNTRNVIPYEYKSLDCGYENPNVAVVFDLDYQSINGKVVLLETYYPKIATNPDDMHYHDYKLFHPMYAWNDEWGEVHNFMDGSINMNVNNWYDIGFTVTHDGIYHVRFLYYGDPTTVTEIDSPWENTYIYDFKYPVSKIFPNFTKWSRFLIGTDGNMTQIGPEPNEYPDYGGWGAFTQLKYICSDFFENATGQETLGNAFEYCRFETLPEGLFDNMTNLESTNGMFQYSNLRTLPVGLLKNNKKLQNVTNMFRGCWLMETSGWDNLTDENGTHFTQRSSSTVPTGYTYLNPQNATGMFQQWELQSIYCSGNIRSNYAYSPLNWKYCPRLYNRTCAQVTYNDATSQPTYIQDVTDYYFSSVLIS